MTIKLSIRFPILAHNVLLMHDVYRERKFDSGEAIWEIKFFTSFSNKQYHQRSSNLGIIFGK
jgi:hypothetical protein